MKVAVVGAGGIGATIAARLAQGGNVVSLVARGKHLDAIRCDGLRFIDREAGSSDTYRLNASAIASELGTQDVVVIAVKAHQIAGMRDAIATLLTPESVVVPAINGMPWWYFDGIGGEFEGLRLQSLDPDGALLHTLPADRILGCVVHFAAEQRAAGEVHCTSGRRLILGEASPARARRDSQRLRDVAAKLTDAGFEVETSHDIRRDVWVKLIGNLSFNPVAALTGYRMDQICADEAVLDVIRAILREGAQVAAAVGVDVGITPDERIAIARKLGAARISMLQDLESGRSLELAPIVGAVIEIAARAQIPVPATHTAHALVQARARALELPLH
jgi:2-dehydropantoate 2-reductase